MGKISVNKSSNLNLPIGKDDNFYFIHSYHFECEKKKYCGICEIWKKKVSAIVSKDNVFGYQFHPEKSGKSGLKVLKVFLRLKMKINKIDTKDLNFYRKKGWVKIKIF